MPRKGINYDAPLSANITSEMWVDLNAIRLYWELPSKAGAVRRFLRDGIEKFKHALSPAERDRFERIRDSVEKSLHLEQVIKEEDTYLPETGAES